jgi:hypothetical protein
MIDIVAGSVTIGVGAGPLLPPPLHADTRPAIKTKPGANLTPQFISILLVSPQARLLDLRDGRQYLWQKFIDVTTSGLQCGHHHGANHGRYRSAREFLDIEADAFQKQRQLADVPRDTLI